MTERATGARLALTFRAQRSYNAAMPLLDHFAPPLSRTHPWRAFHGAWSAATARLLNAGVLPAGYYAVPFLDRDGPVEIDVAALRRTAPESGGVLTWAPAAPALVVAVDWPEVDEVTVEVYSDEGDPHLAAAIEFVSPRNKDRPQARAAFGAKCAGYLGRGCGLVVVDAVTTRRADLHAELLAALSAEPAGISPGELSATAYLAGTGQLLAWPAALELGAPLPTLPLWLGADLAVPLDLDASYAAARADLRLG